MSLVKEISKTLEELELSIETIKYGPQHLIGNAVLSHLLSRFG